MRPPNWAGARTRDLSRGSTLHFRLVVIMTFSLTLVITLVSLQVLRSDGRGWGLKSPDTIKKGEFVVEYVGELISMAEYRRRMAVNQEEKEENYYYLSIDSNRYGGNNQ